MATEELIVLLDAQTQKLDAKLKATEKRLDNFEGKTGKADKSLMSMSATAKSVGAGLLKVATVVLAVNAAVSAMVLSAASGRKELEALSRQAKTSTENFQALSFATMQYGVNAEQIGDISKDISDKMSEFSIAGTGAFQDYADSIKLTKDEARQAAKEFTTMSSEEVIGKMVSEMEKAGVSATDMTFALESVGNDLSKLQPLFAGNSSELSKLKDRFKLVNDELSITGSQAEKLKEVSTSYQLMTTQLGNASTAISATLAPVMDDFFNDIISVVPTATQTIIDFANSFLDAENISSIDGVNKQIQASQARILETEIERAAIAKQANSYAKDGGAFNASALRQLDESIAGERTRTEELNNQLLVLEAQNKKLADARSLKGGQIGGESGDGTSGGIGTGDEIQAIADRFKTEEELLSAKLTRELELVGEDKDLRYALEEEYLMSIVTLEQEAEDKKKKAAADAIKDTAILKEKAAKAEIALTESVAKNAMSLTKMILGDSKAAAILALGIQKAQALSANATATASGATLAFAAQQIPGDPTSFARGTAAASSVKTMGAINAGLIIATGLGEAAGIAKGDSGGGLSGSGGGAITPRSEAGNFQEETSSLSLTDSGSGGSSSTQFTFATDTGDQLMDLIAESLNKGRAEGRFNG